jgi:hypothetical protein
LIRLNHGDKNIWRQKDNDKENHVGGLEECKEIPNFYQLLDRGGGEDSDE